MKLAVAIKLAPTPEQHAALLATLKRFNAACNADRTTVGRRQRARQSNWAFAQLGAFVQYKAQTRGVVVVRVDPRHTSQTCLACGHVARTNRRSQAWFECVSCGFAGPADTVAACVIATRARAAVMRPNVDPLIGKVAEWEHGVEAPATSRLL